MSCASAEPARRRGRSGAACGCSARPPPAAGEDRHSLHRPLRRGLVREEVGEHDVGHLARQRVRLEHRVIGPQVDARASRAAVGETDAGGAGARRRGGRWPWRIPRRSGGSRCRTLPTTGRRADRSSARRSPSEAIRPAWRSFSASSRLPGCRTRKLAVSTTSGLPTTTPESFRDFALAVAITC